MEQKLFGCYDTAILVKSNSKELLNDLIRIYGEYYQDIYNPTYVLNFIVGKKPDDYDIKDKEVEDSTYNYIKSNEDGLTIYLDDYNQPKKQFAKRIFTNSFVRAFQKNDYIIIHGACVKDQDGNSLIIGDKGSGKTTTLINLINNGYTFVSNDKVAVKLTNGKVITCGIPFSMGIIKKDAEVMYNFDIKRFYSTGDKIYLKVSDIPNFFNTYIENKGRLKQILFTDYQPTIDALKMVKVDNNLNAIGDNILVNAVSEQKQYLNDLLKVDVKHHDLDYLNQINGYIVSQNKDTTEELLETLKQDKIKL
ncbi:MAG: hypothetical protein PHE05_03175 [Bacilli bacterium]|nr:hypothetical protein [Bacilli bacterium]